MTADVSPAAEPAGLSTRSPTFVYGCLGLFALPFAGSGPVAAALRTGKLGCMGPAPAAAHPE